MTTYTTEQLEQIFENLPDELRKAIASVESANILMEVGKKHNLLIDKIGEMSDETGMVLFGLTHPKDFVANLASRLGVDIETARNIADEINTKIFAQVRESLKKMHGMEEKSKPPAEAERPAVQPAWIAQFSPRTAEIPGQVLPTKEDILKEIESGENRQKTNGLFESKTKDEIFRAPMQEKRREDSPMSENVGYGASKDPYKEKIE
jgi:hypothetical protein